MIANNMENIERLRTENMQLKRALSVLMKKSLIRELVEAMHRIDSGEYVSEEEFFRDSPLKVA